MRQVLSVRTGVSTVYFLMESDKKAIVSKVRSLPVNDVDT